MTGISLVLLSSLEAQQTHIVSGATDSLRLTVAGASNGDILLVRSGSYQGFLTDKGMTIRCDPGVVILASPLHSIYVSGIPLGQSFVLEGGDLQGFSGFDYSTGFIHLQGVTARKGISVLSSKNVSMHNVSLESLSVSNSNLVVAASTVVQPKRGFLALSIGKASVHMSDTQVTTTSTYPSLGAVLIDEGGHLLITGSRSKIEALPLSGASPAVVGIGGILSISPEVALVHGSSLAVSGRLTVHGARFPNTEATQVGSNLVLAAKGNRADYTATFVSAISTPYRFLDQQLWLDPSFVMVGSVGLAKTHTIPIPVGLPLPLPITAQSISLGTLFGRQVWVGPATRLMLH